VLAAKKQFLSYVWEEVQVLLASESQAILVRRNPFKTTKSIAALVWPPYERSRALHKLGSSLHASFEGTMGIA